MRKKSDKVIAGIVLFNPNPERLMHVIRSICCQVSELVLVDNGSKDFDGICSAIKDFRSIRIIRNKENWGIAKALNQISEYGHANGYEWCLTLDQDTVCCNDMVKQLLCYSKEERIGILCPRVDYEGSALKQEGAETVDVYACMTSGSLMRLDAWSKVGGFRESYFIDFVDNEFCMRLGLSGYRIVRVNSCIMYHQLGERTRVKVLGLFSKDAIVHSPWRYYYMTRNNLLFIKQYKKNLNIFREYGKLASILYSAVLYTNTSKENLSYIIRGFRDACHNKEGRLELETI